MHHWRTAAALAFCLTSVAACGGKTNAAPPHTTTATPQATQIAPELVAYAQQARPVLKQSLDTVNGLVSELNSSHDYNQIAFDCSDKAAGIESADNLFQGIAPPSQAQSYVSVAIQGYQSALTATSECSTAADARLPNDLSTAASDMSQAASQLGRAEAGVNAWYQAH